VREEGGGEVFDDGAIFCPTKISARSMAGHGVVPELIL